MRDIRPTFRSFGGCTPKCACIRWRSGCAKTGGTSVGYVSKFPGTNPTWERMMRLLSISMAVGFVATLAVNTPRAAPDMADWQTYRNDAGGYAFKYPGGLSLSIPSGTVCTNGDCKPVEEVMLRRYTPADGSIRTLQFIIQRGINPQ